MNPVCLVSRAQILTALKPETKQKMKLLKQSGVKLKPVPGDMYHTLDLPATVGLIARKYERYIEQVWRDDSTIELPAWLKADAPTLAQLPAGYVVSWPVVAENEVSICTH